MDEGVTKPFSHIGRCLSLEDLLGTSGSGIEDKVVTVGKMKGLGSGIGGGSGLDNSGVISP